MRKTIKTAYNEEIGQDTLRPQREMFSFTVGILEVIGFALHPVARSSTAGVHRRRRMGKVRDEMEPGWGSQVTGGGPAQGAEPGSGT